MEQILIGRYRAGDDLYITPEIAKQLVATEQVVEIRSVLTCKDQCCSKCYGENIGHKSPAVVGHAVGAIAAQAIGELGTQLSMDTFQQGGVMSGKDIASDFDRINAFLRMQDIAKNKRFPLYDPIAWATGDIEERVLSNLQKAIRIAGNKKEIRMSRDIEIKKTVVKGEPISVRLGDCAVDEILMYKSLEEAQLYLSMAMYVTYRVKEAINFKHFECLVAGMTLHLVLDAGGRKDLREGKFCTTQQLYAGNASKVKVKSMLKGIQRVPLLRSSILSTIDMERVVEGLSRSLLTETTEDFSGVLEAILIGQPPQIGTYYPNYLTDRETAPYSFK
jgi:DNA-directed RNA polymerase subunit beta'